MNWVSQHLNRQFRLFFDSEVWLIGLPVMGLMIAVNVNQAVAMIVSGVFCYFLQKTVDRNPSGYVLHLLDRWGIVNRFPRKGRYRF